MFATGASPSANKDAYGTDELFVTDITSANPTNACSQMNVFSPNKAEVTTYNVLGGVLIGTDPYVQTAFGFQNSTTQFTGFTILANTGTFGGTVSVYGYNK